MAIETHCLGTDDYLTKPINLSATARPVRVARSDLWPTEARWVQSVRQIGLMRRSGNSTAVYCGAASGRVLKPLPTICPPLRSWWELLLAISDTAAACGTFGL